MRCVYSVYLDSPSRVIEAGRILEYAGCIVRYPNKYNDLHEATDILITAMPQESEHKKVPIIRTASHRVESPNSIATPNRLGIYVTAEASLDIPLLEAAAAIEEWRVGNYTGNPWGPSEPTEEANVLLYEQWLKEVQILRNLSVDWEETPDLKQVLMKQRRYRYKSPVTISQGLLSPHTGWMLG